MTDKLRNGSMKGLNISRLQEDNKGLQNLVEQKRAEARELSEKLLSLKWKTKRAEFVSYYEEKEREEQRQKISKLNEKIDLADEKWSGVENQIEEWTNKQKKLASEKEENDEELQRLQQADQKNETAMKELQRSVNVLKNRNAAMMLKLKKQKQEFDDQIQKYSLQLHKTN